MNKVYQLELHGPDAFLLSLAPAHTVVFRLKDDDYDLAGLTQASEELNGQGEEIVSVVGSGSSGPGIRPRFIIVTKVITEPSAEVAKPEKTPLTTEEQNVLRHEIFDLIAEMKGPPYENGLAIRTSELQMRLLQIHLNKYYRHVPVATDDGEVPHDYPPDAMPLG